MGDGVGGWGAGFDLWSEIMFNIYFEIMFNIYLAIDWISVICQLEFYVISSGWTYLGQIIVVKNNHYSQTLTHTLSLFFLIYLYVCLEIQLGSAGQAGWCGKARGWASPQRTLPANLQGRHTRDTAGHDQEFHWKQRYLSVHELGRSGQQTCRCDSARWNDC